MISTEIDWVSRGCSDLDLEILDVSQITLSIEDILRVAEMEIHPEVRRGGYVC